jgi:hypothetical protein
MRGILFCVYLFFLATFWQARPVYASACTSSHSSCPRCIQQLIPVAPHDLTDAEKTAIHKFFSEKFELHPRLKKILDHYFGPASKSHPGFLEFLSQMSHRASDHYEIERSNLLRADGNIIWVQSSLLVGIATIQFFNADEQTYFQPGANLPKFTVGEKLRQGKAFGDFMATLLYAIYSEAKSREDLAEIRVFSLDIYAESLFDVLPELGFKKFGTTRSAIFALDLIPKKS